MKTPTTPSWTRSEDVRKTLNVLDQVLSEFDDFDSEFDSSSEDRDVKTVEKRSQITLKIESNDRKPVKKFNKELKQVSNAPQVDRSRKPKGDLPALPSKVGNRKSSNGSPDLKNSSDSSLSKSSSHISSESDTLESSLSSKSKDSLGSLCSTSSGTHCYQEINSDLCNSNKRIGNRDESDKDTEEEAIEEKQELLKLEQQKRILEENLRNAQRSRGRSIEAKRSGDNRGKRAPSRGRSANRNDNKERTSRRYHSEVRNNNRNRSKSNDRHMEHKRPYKNQDRKPSIPNHSKNDSRSLMEQQMIEQMLIESRMAANEQRFVDAHFIDPRMVGPPLDQIPPHPDQMVFPHLINYPPDPYPHNNFIEPIMPPPEFGGYPVHPYDMQYLPPHPAMFSPDEVHHMQVMNPNSFQGIPYDGMNPMVPNPMVEYYLSMGYHPQEIAQMMYSFQEGHPNEMLMRNAIHNLAPEQILPERRFTEGDFERDGGNPLGKRNSGPSPAQLVKELRLSCRHPNPHTKPNEDSTDTSSSSFNLDDSGVKVDKSGFRVDDKGFRVDGSGFRVGEEVGVRDSFQPTKIVVTNSLPNFSHGKDSGFDELPTVEDSNSLGKDTSTVKTVGKTKGGMVVSGVLTNVSNMYIPAPPSPLPDYDGEAKIDDGAESDIVEESQFVSKKKDKKLKTKKKNSEVVEINVKSEKEKLKRSESASASAGKSLSENISRSSNSGPKKNSFEKLMDKFHESLPHLSSHVETRFSDDSLDDEDAPVDMVHLAKKHLNESVDSLYSANDSTASFDYIEPVNQIPSKKMGRSNSHNSSNVNQKAMMFERNGKNMKKSNSQFNVSITNRIINNDANTRSNSSEHSDSVSTSSANNSDFNTIKRLLKEGLIDGLDEEPPDFAPPPLPGKVNRAIESFESRSNSSFDKKLAPKIIIPKNSFKNITENKYSSIEVNKNNSRRNSNENIVTQNHEKKHSLKIEINRTASINSIESKMSRVKHENSHSFRKSVEEKTTNKNQKKRDSDHSSEKKRRISQSFSSSSGERTGERRSFESNRSESPPPLPPPRETSLPKNHHQEQLLQTPEHINATFTDFIKPTLIEVPPSGIVSVERKKSNSPLSNSLLNPLDNQLSEMVEVSIYTKSVRDSERITHIDECTDFINTENTITHSTPEKNETIISSKVETTDCAVDSVASDSEIVDLRITYVGSGKKKLESNNSPIDKKSKISNVDDRWNRKSEVSIIQLVGDVQDHDTKEPKKLKKTESKSQKTSRAESERVNRTHKIDNHEMIDLRNKPTKEPYRQRSESQHVVVDKSNHSIFIESTDKISPSDKATRAHSPSKKRFAAPQPPANGNRRKESKRFTSTEDLSHQIPSNSTSFDPSASNEAQELKRATSLVLSANKKGKAPPVPKPRTIAPDAANASKSQDPPTAGFMPSEDADSKSRFNIFRGFWKKNKYSFDKS